MLLLLLLHCIALLLRLLVGQRPGNKREIKPPFPRTSLSCPGHLCEPVTVRMTWSTCWPHPAHVVLPHVLHLTARHIGFSFSYGPWNQYTPRGIGSRA